MDTGEDNPPMPANGTQAGSAPYAMDGLRNELEYLEDIPKAIIFTNLPDAVFEKTEPNTVKVRTCSLIIADVFICSLKG